MDKKFNLISSIKNLPRKNYFTWTPDLFDNPVIEAVFHYEFLMSLIYSKRNTVQIKNYHKPNKLSVYENFYEKYLRDRFFEKSGSLTEDSFYKEVFEKRITNQVQQTDLDENGKKKIINDANKYMQLHEQGYFEYSLAWIGLELGIFFLIFCFGFLLSTILSKLFYIYPTIIFFLFGLMGIYSWKKFKDLYEGITKEEAAITLRFKYLPINIQQCFDELENCRVFLDNKLNKKNRLEVLIELENLGRIKECGDHYILYGSLEKFVEWIFLTGLKKFREENKVKDYSYLEAEFIYDNIYKTETKRYSLETIKKIYQSMNDIK